MEQLTRKQLLARLAYCEFEFGAGDVCISAKDKVEAEFYSTRGYYDCTDAELVDALEFYDGIFNDDVPEDPINWPKIEEEYASWADKSKVVGLTGMLKGENNATKEENVASYLCELTDEQLTEVFAMVERMSVSNAMEDEDGIPEL